MAYPIELRRKILELRKRGYSLNELHNEFKVAKGTLSLWISNINLSRKAKARLLRKIKLGQFTSAENKKARTKALEKEYIKNAASEIKHSPNYDKIICAIMYWCEGNKNPKDGLAFTNSDPVLVSKFLELLRKSYPIIESKFHPCIHLHSYHSLNKQLDFWSKITKINKKQFIKPYQKQNSGKRIRDGYQGCISVRYYDNDLARRVMATAKAFLGV